MIKRQVLTKVYIIFSLLDRVEEYEVKPNMKLFQEWFAVLTCVKVSNKFWVLNIIFGVSCGVFSFLLCDCVRFMPELICTLNFEHIKGCSDWAKLSLHDDSRLFTFMIAQGYSMCCNLKFWGIFIRKEPTIDFCKIISLNC